METIEIKKDIFQIIDKINDNSILHNIENFIYAQISSNNVDFWDKLPDNVKNSINKGIEQAENGVLTAHNEVMQNVKSKYLNK